MNKDLKKSFAKCLCCGLFRGNRIEEFNSWFKENTPKEGLSNATTFTKQFVNDAWDNGYSAGYAKANKEYIESILEDYANTEVENDWVVSDKEPL